LTEQNVLEIIYSSLKLDLYDDSKLQKVKIR
jgi:hypothetical protein